MSSPLTVTLISNSTGAGFFSCNCTAGGSGKLCASLTHESFTGTLGIVYKLWVKAISLNPRNKEK